MTTNQTIRIINLPSGRFVLFRDTDQSIDLTLLMKDGETIGACLDRFKAESLERSERETKFRDKLIAMARANSLRWLVSRL